MVAFKHIPGPENKADIFTKNVDATSLHKHSAKLFGGDGLLMALKGEKPLSEGGCRKVTLSVGALAVYNGLRCLNVIMFTNSFLAK